MGEFKEVNEDSKYLYFVADNSTQFVWLDMVWERLGGMRCDTTELQHYVRPQDDDWSGVVIGSTFVILAPKKNLIRAFMGHGTSDKGIFKFQGYRGAVGMDYYYMSGHKDCWHFSKHGHALQHPYNKVLKMGLPRSDYFIHKDKTYNRNDILKEFGIETNREIVLFAPTFNTGSLEYYYYDILKQLHKKYFVVIKKHDREFFFGDSTRGGRLFGRTLDDKRFTLKPTMQKKLTKNLFEYRGSADPVKFLTIADYYMGDCSSLDYLAMFADIPIVMVEPYNNARTDVAYEYDIRNTAPFYQRGADLLNIIERAKGVTYTEARHDFIKRNFYYNDGHAQDRMCEHTQKLVERLKRRIFEDWEDPHLERQLAITKTITAAREKMRAEAKDEQPFNSDKDIEQI